MSDTADAPTPTALAARALMDCIDRPHYLRTLRTRAHMAGWRGARLAGLWDTRVSDAVAEATLDGVLDLLRAWAREVPEPDPPTTAAIERSRP